MRGIGRCAAGLATALMLFLVDASVVLADPPPDMIAVVVAKVSSSVVRIIAVRPPVSEAPAAAKVASAPAPDNHASTADNDMFAIGSGFIINPSGFIATNKHVVADSTAVFVVTAEGVRYPATIVGMTDKADMALLRISVGHDLPSLPFSDSDKMLVGDPVIAIGSPFGFDNSVTAGILSAVNRDIMESPFDDYFQTDAAINHGNSGGPLFNLAGEVIGMNSVIFAPGTGSVGLGFALPSNDLRFVFDRLMKTGEIRAGMLPIHTQQVSWMLEQALGAPSLNGALVSAVMDDGDAMLHGKIRAGDIILTFNGEKVWDPRDLARKAARAPIGSDAVLQIDRGGVQETVHVTIQAWPEAKIPAAPEGMHKKLGLDLIGEQRDGGKALVVVSAVDPTGTAADSGIQKGDIILEVQRVPVTAPDQALRVFQAQSFVNHPYAAVLVERDNKRSWMPMALPPK
jgi:serine protease Do